MKAKFDFVTNSSSSCYIIALAPGDVDLLNKVISYLEKENPDSNNGIGIGDEFRNLKELQEYVNGGPFDWVSECTGLQYENMSKINYEKCKDVIDDGLMAAFVFVDHDMIEDFETEIKNYINIIDCDG